MVNKNKKKSTGGRILTNMLMFLIVFVIMVIHILAVAISLQCSENKNLFFRISTALFAFMFGIFYLVVNYYYLRIYRNNKLCDFSSENIFGLF